MQDDSQDDGDLRDYIASFFTYDVLAPCGEGGDEARHRVRWRRRGSAPSDSRREVLRGSSPALYGHFLKGPGHFGLPPFLNSVFS